MVTKASKRDAGLWHSVLAQLPANFRERMMPGYRFEAYDRGIPEVPEAQRLPVIESWFREDIQYAFDLFEDWNGKPKSDRRLELRDSHRRLDECLAGLAQILKSQALDVDYGLLLARESSEPLGYTPNEARREKESLAELKRSAESCLPIFRARRAEIMDKLRRKLRDDPSFDDLANWLLSMFERAGGKVSKKGDIGGKAQNFLFATLTLGAMTSPKIAKIVEDNEGLRGKIRFRVKKYADDKSR